MAGLGLKQVQVAQALGGGGVLVLLIEQKQGMHLLYVCSLLLEPCNVKQAWLMLKFHHTYQPILELRVISCYSVDAKKPIGLENGQLSEDQITVSSTYAPDGNERPFRKGAARLNHVGTQEDLGGAWVPTQEDIAPWIQVDAGVEAVMTGVITQGRHSKQNWWVTSYNVKFSTNCQDWLNVKDAAGGLAVRVLRNFFLSFFF